MKWSILAAYALTVPAANYLIENVGVVCVNGACLIPVGFGLTAPSGVLMIGVALVLRDFVQFVAGPMWGLMAIVIGTALSFVFSSPSVAMASVAAFAWGEIFDYLIYTRLQQRGLIIAVLASSAISSIIDSAIFLLFAFGSLDFMAGQVVGKWLSILAATGVMIAGRAALAGEKKDE